MGAENLMKHGSRMARCLHLRRLPLLLALLAVALALPAAWSGWQMDDLLHRYMLLGYPDATGNRTAPLDLFFFLDGNPAHGRVLLDAGIIPWWSSLTVRLSFWRPLSSLTHWLDYLLWPDNSALMHLQSLAWFGLLVILAALLYRRILGRTWTAGLAALFFALDDAHGLAAGWLANRNALLAGVFAIAALLAYHRWRSQDWRPGALLAPLLLLTGLLSGELALAACGYLFAYMLFLDHARLRARLLALVPCAMVALGWLVVYSLLGYGTKGSGFYVDPLSEPLRFLQDAAWKTPLLLTDQWALPPTSFVSFLPDRAVPLLLAWAVPCLLLVTLLLAPLVRRDRTARFWALGMLLSILLVCTTKPHSRLLLFTGIGGFGLLAQWIAAVREKAGWLPAGTLWNRTARVMLPAFFVIHIPVAALLLPFEATSPAFGQRMIQDPVRAVKAGPELASQDVIVLNHPVVFYALYFRGARLVTGLPAPRRMRVLAPGNSLLHVSRPDARTLLVRPESGFLGQPFDDVFRSPHDPMRVDQEVAVADMIVRITRMTPDGRPAEAAFRFPIPLEDPSMRWLKWTAGHYEDFSLPAPGDSCMIPGSSLFF